MHGMIEYSESFNVTLFDWDISSVYDMEAIFYNDSYFSKKLYLNIDYIQYKSSMFYMTNSMRIGYD